MFRIEGNDIYLTRGDTAIIDFSVDNYSFVDGDIVFFSVKKSKSDTTYVIQKEITSFEDNIAKITLSSNETNLDKGKYWYDIQCNLVDGRVDTVITPSRFILEGDITNV